MFDKFLKDDAGAVTVDWVALTSGALLVGIMVVYAIYNNGVSSLVTSVNNVDPGYDRSAALFHIDNMNAD